MNSPAKAPSLLCGTACSERFDAAASACARELFDMKILFDAVKVAHDAIRARHCELPARAGWAGWSDTSPLTAAANQSRPLQLGITKRPLLDAAEEDATELRFMTSKYASFAFLRDAELVSEHRLPLDATDAFDAKSSLGVSAAGTVGALKFYTAQVMVKDAITVRRVHTVPGQLDCAVPFVGTECGPGVALQPGEMFFSFFLHAQEGFTRPAGSNRLLIRRRLAFGRFGPAVWALSPQGARPVMQAGDRVDSCTGILVDWTERPGHGIIFGLPATFNSGGATYPLTASVIRYASYVEVLLDLALPDEVLVEPGDTLMLAPGCQVCAEAGKLLCSLLSQTQQRSI
jgi:hypothetical protein